MFLDIQMPQINGVEFLKSLENPPLYYISDGYFEYAMDGFELNVIDYLLKPISMDRFLKSVNKVSEKLEARKSEIPEEHATDTYFFVKADKKLVKVNFSEIIYIEGLKTDVIIKQENGRVITLQTMNLWKKNLPSALFRRIHRSFIVSINKIQAIDGNTVEVMEKGQVKHLPIGKNYRDDIVRNDK